MKRATRKTEIFIMTPEYFVVFFTSILNSLRAYILTTNAKLTCGSIGMFSSTDGERRTPGQERHA